jgi:AmmeMemoRadiSam system protein B
MWYPEHPEVLSEALEKYLKTGLRKKPATGIVVPHAAYEYSGKIAGTAFSIAPKNIQKAIIIGPSHYVYLYGVCTANVGEWHTPLGKIKLFNKDFFRGNIEQEHSIKNQIPFLQKIGVKEIMPLMIGKLSDNEAKEIAKKLSKIKAFYVFSTDLSHFLPYKNASAKDRETINILETLNFEDFNYTDACGQFPLMVMMHLCKIKHKKPHLIQYKNSGDVTGDKSAVVGYCSMWF